MPNYKCLLFDMDGTIADTDEMILLSYNEMYRRYGHGKAKGWDEVMYFSGPPLRETLVKEFPDLPLDELLKAFAEISDPYYDSTVKVFHHEIETLEYLYNKGYKMGVVTNKATYKAHYVLEMLHIDKYFDVLIGREDVIKGKPSGEGIVTAINKLGFKNSETLYIGDNDIDYETALDAGVDAMIVAWGPRKLTVLDKCKYVINKYEEMEEVL